MTILGYIVVPCGIFMLIWSRRWLYRSFVFSLLFSATVILNVRNGENASGVQVWMYFGVLLLVQDLYNWITSKSYQVNRELLVPFLLLSSFIAIATVSLIMPVLIDGRLSIASPYLLDVAATPLYLTSKNFTQLLYLVFGFLTALSIATKNTDAEVREESEKVFLLSGGFVALWGLLQFVCGIVGLEYPSFVFNNSKSLAASGFLQQLAELEGVKRISSVTVEPSMLAQCLYCVLPLAIPSVLKNGCVLSVFWDRCLFGLFFMVLLVSTSSTAYIGFFPFALMCTMLLWRIGHLRRIRTILRWLLALAAIITAFVVIVIFVPFLRDFFNTQLFGKASGGSGLERLMTITNAFSYFIRYPILGIGWGSATSHDLIVKLLSNSGIVGTATFLGFVIAIINRNYAGVTPSLHRDTLSRLVWTLSFAILICTSVILEFPFTFGHFWFVTGMAMATSVVDPISQASWNFKGE
jgi:hypothetical protein